MQRNNEPKGKPTMKYDYVTFVKKAPGVWVADPGVPTATFPDRETAFYKLNEVHGLHKGLGWSGNHGVESVTRILFAGERKNTADLDCFFEYTFSPLHTTDRKRYRVAILPHK